MLRKLVAVAALAACSLGSSVPLAEKVGVQVLSDHRNEIELAVTDDTLDSDGLLVSASVDVKVDVLDGIAMINGQYVLPIGLTHIAMKTDVKKYVMSPIGKKRKCHKTLHDVDVGIAARVSHDPKALNTMHITLQLTEFDGVTREIEHTTLVSVSLNEKDEELVRTIDPKSKPLTRHEKLEAAKHKISKFVEKATDAMQDDAQSAEDWFMTYWNNANDYGKVSIVAVISLVSFIVLVGFVCLVNRICCVSSASKSKGSNYQKNLGKMRVDIMPTNQFKSVKYTLLKNEA